MSKLVYSIGFAKAQPSFSWNFSRFKHRFPGAAKVLPPENKPRYKWDIRHLKELTGGNYTIEPLAVRRLGGRDPETGRKVNQHVGGGVKFDYFMVDHSYPRRYAMNFTNPENTYDERVLEVRRDPNRTAYIALVAGLYGKRWIVATENLSAGHIIKSSAYIPEIPYIGEKGMIYKIGALNTGTMVCCIEHYPSINSPVMVTKAGAYGIITRQTDKQTAIKLNYGKEFVFDKNCFAMCGQVSHADIKDKIWGSANMHRRYGYKMSSGLRLKKTGYQGRKVKQVNLPVIVTNRCVNTSVTLKKFTLSKEPAGPLSGLSGTAAVHPLISKIHYRF